MTEAATHPAAAAKPVPPKPPAPPKELTPAERAQALLTHFTEQARHNAPITQWALSELQALVNGMTGNKAVVLPHDFADEIMFKKPDGHTMLVYSAEEALAYVRSLPKDVQDRPHWVSADKALAAAIETMPGTDVSDAGRAFSLAAAADRKAAPTVAVPAKPDAPKPAHA